MLFPLFIFSIKIKNIYKTNFFVCFQQLKFSLNIARLRENVNGDKKL